MLAVPSAAASAINQTTGVERTTARWSAMMSVCMPTTLGDQAAAMLAENGHGGPGSPTWFVHNAIGEDNALRVAEVAGEVVRAGLVGIEPAPVECWFLAAAQCLAAARPVVPSGPAPLIRPWSI